MRKVSKSTFLCCKILQTVGKFQSTELQVQQIELHTFFSSCVHFAREAMETTKKEKKSIYALQRCTFLNKNFEKKKN